MSQLQSLLFLIKSSNIDKIFEEICNIIPSHVLKLRQTVARSIIISSNKE